MGDFFKIQFIEHHNRILIEELVYLDEISTVPYSRILDNVNNFYEIYYTRLGLSSPIKRIFRFYLIDNEGNKKLVTNKSDVLLPSAGEDIKGSEKYFLGFNKNGILELTVTPIQNKSLKIISKKSTLFFSCDNLMNNNQIVQLLIQPRITSEIKHYNTDDSIILNLSYSNQESGFFMEKEDLTNLLINNMNPLNENPSFLFDLIIDGKLQFVNLSDEEVILHDPVKLVITGNTIKLNLWGRYIPKIQKMNIIDNMMNLEISVNNRVEFSQLRITPRTYNYLENITPGIGIEPINKNKEAVVYNIDPTALKSNQVFHQKIIDTFLTVSILGHQYTTRPKVTGDFQLVNDISERLNLRPFITKMNSLAFKLGNTVQDLNKKNKVVLMGTDYTNLVFENDEYFNPEAAREFQIVDSHEHSSVISAVSRKIEKIDTSKAFSSFELSDDLLKNIYREYNKVFFDELSTKNLEETFFIFDLYADSSLSLIEWGKNEYTTASYYYRYALESFLSSHMDDITMLTHSNPRFFDIWKSSFMIFMEKVTSLFEDRIILISAKRATEFRDKNGNIALIDNFMYGKSLEVARTADFWLDQMHGFILEKYTQVKFIDLSKYNFLADRYHPKKLSTNHYESNYYKVLYTEIKALMR